MREIKYKAFDKVTQKIYNVELIDFETQSVKIGTEHVPNQHNFTWYRKFDGVELLEYTGLKDKNGIEIYEGDIVEYSEFRFPKNERPDLYSRGSISIGEGYINAYDDFNSLIEIYGVCINSDSLDLPSIAECEYVEIIGTIYENPELLESK